MALPDYKQAHDEIVKLFDFSAQLLETVEDKSIQNPEAQFELVHDFVVDIEESAEDLSEEFCKIAHATQQNKTAKPKKIKIETAFRRLFAAIDAYKINLKDNANRLKGDVLNIADPIVDKLRKHVTKIVGIFLSIIELSVDRFMHKSEVEQLKKDQHIAAMLHNMSLGHS